MKNKEVYNLKELNFKVGSLTDGCGRKISGMYYTEISILENGKNKVIQTLTSNSAIKEIMNWLEEENGKK